MRAAVKFRRRLAVVVAVTVLSPAASGLAPSAAQTVAARNADPIAFFSGRTEGTGTLDTITASPKATHVTGVGTMRSGGLFVLDQTVGIAGDPTRQRQWQLRETAPGQFRGSLSDAKTPVTGSLTGNRMRIRYTLKDGIGVDQTLVFAADGRSAANTMKLRKFGIAVGTLRETIRKV
jgi:hypothetical protein